MSRKATKQIDEDQTTKKKEKPQDEPSWYHYLIVILIIMGMFGVLYLGYYFFIETGNSNPNPNPINNNTILYKYPYKVGNVTYNLHFESDIEELENMQYTIQPQRIDILNTINFRLSFMQYNGTDNGQVAKGSTKLTSFLKRVHRYSFSNESFVHYNQTNCTDSTKSKKVIIFNPYSDKNGVFYNQTNGCIEFLTNEPTKMIDITDKFIYEMTLGQNEQKN